jgi:polysaccharide pyruvyl transferase WcaK-like protein
MRIGGPDRTTDDVDTGEPRYAAYRARTAGQEAPEPHPRIALLTPYTGNNLGDAAIQDAVIANLRLRVPGARFSGISLNCDNFVERHGERAFPLCTTGMSRGAAGNQSEHGERYTEQSDQKSLNAAAVKRAIKRVPVLGRCLKTIYTLGKRFWREFRHCLGGYRFLRAQDLLIVSGGGQLDDEWGGPWRHPFALFKWAMLARTAHVPYVVASVGASKATSKTSQLLMSTALRMARYRSYRDKNSRDIAASLLPRAAGDSVVPDLAFSLLSSELPSPAGLRSISQGRKVVAISPMAFAKPGSWPYEDRALYDRYLQQMARVISELLERGYFLVIVCSALSDASVMPEILALLERDTKKKLAQQIHIPTITAWKELVALLLDVDFLVASRLHSVVFGFLTQRPTVAISFDPKVDWVMEDLGQTEHLLHIRDFSAGDVIEALGRLELRSNLVMEQIASYQHRILAACAQQYDALAELAMAGCRYGNW